MMLIFFTMSLYGILVTAFSLLYFGSFSATFDFFYGRILAGIWGESVNATTLVTFHSFSLASLPLLSIQLKKRNFLTSVLLAILFIISSLISFFVASRTAILIILVAIVYTLIVNFSKKLIIIGSIISIDLGTIALVLRWQILAIGGDFSIESHNLLVRLLSTDLSQDYRFNAWAIILRNLSNYPLGQRLAPIEISYAHNLWLDITYEVGIIPTIFLLVFTVMTIVNSINIMKKKINEEIKILWGSMNVSFYIIFMTEPILQVNALMFFVYCFICGMIFKIKDLELSYGE